MRIGRALAVLIALASSVVSGACSRDGFFRQFEYEEEIYLALDGSATVYVNASVAALNALRGATFDPAPNASIDRGAVRAWFTSPLTRVTRNPSLSRRSGRRFVHVRLDVDAIAQLSKAVPFAWSTYSFDRAQGLVAYRQAVGVPGGKATGAEGWKGQERVAFRLHLPSTIVYHNAGAGNPRRGNILVWEQSLADRLGGDPLVFEARIESQSILSRTLLLFGATGAAVATSFALVVWWVARRGGKARQNAGL
jgi:hypothetical protein